MAHSDKPARGFNRRIENSIKDEIRIDLQLILSERSATPGELAELLKADPDEILRHLAELWADNCIEVVAEEQPQGDAAVRRYRAAGPLFVDDPESQQLSPAEREEAAAAVLQPIVNEALAALRTGSIGSRSDLHLSRKPMLLDERGWRELMALLLRALKEAETIEESCKERLAFSDEPGIETIVALLGFERGKRPKP